MACAQRIWTFISKRTWPFATKSLFPFFCHSVTITSWSNRPSILAKLNIVYSFSSTCPSGLFSQRPGSEDGEHKPPLAKRPRVHADADLNQNVSVFPSLIFCHSIRATLHPASAALSSLPSLLSLPRCSFICTSSFVSGIRHSVTLCPIDHPAPFIWPINSVALGILLLNSRLAILHISYLLQMTDPLVINDELWWSTSSTCATSSVSRWCMCSWVIAEDDLDFFVYVIANWAVTNP